MVQALQNGIQLNLSSAERDNIVKRKAEPWLSIGLADHLTWNVSVNGLLSERKLYCNHKGVARPSATTGTKCR